MSLSLNALLAALRSEDRFAELVAALRPARARVSLTAADCGHAALVAALAESLERRLLLVCQDSAEARRLHEQIRLYAAEPENVLLFPEQDRFPFERIPLDAATRKDRATCLGSLVGSGEGLRTLVVVASVTACLERLMARTTFASASMTVRVGDRLDVTSLSQILVDAGYERVPMVQEVGTFARRGGILDVFSPMQELPARLELLGNEVDTIRLFDPASQLSESRVESVRIVPAREAVAEPQLKTVQPGLLHGHEDSTPGHLEPLRGEELDMLAPWTAEGGLFDYVGTDAVTVLMEPQRLRAAAQEHAAQVAESRARHIEQGAIDESYPATHLTFADGMSRWEGGGGLVELSAFETIIEGAGPAGGRGVTMTLESLRPLPGFGGRLRQFAEELAAQRKRSAAVVVSHQAERLAELLRERGVVASLQDGPLGLPQKGEILLVKGVLAQGFGLDALRVFSDHELFGWSKPTRRAAPAKSAARRLALESLSEGDHIVHVEHGVGVYRGMRLIEADGSGPREYLVLEYAEGDLLYVPTDQAERVSRYYGIQGHEPSLHRLGTGDWARVKERVNKAVMEVAKDLLRLYAVRQAQTGFAFTSDNTWQYELEASFPFIETPDQVEAIKAVKADMESPRPMDRLVCGDVGYGKTEVAIRAAFKAVSDGKQVAVLVPTTVLAQQHHRTFTERLQAFPVRVELLSRFLSDREQRDVLDDLEAGKVDICIGTHRLIQTDVKFRDLGLVVVDEEQRFGVMHKERLKRLRTEVDVLTLTATPIPRTLYMALSGVRDLSTMDTPPEERLPIRNFLSEYDDGIVREAILRELERGGQVYFVHNRVQSIYFMAESLRALIPEASVVVGHGQMPEEELERVMLEFAAGKHDILLCTTIIESGLDIPNVNTIIVNNSDKLGLSQLYQLRGRVGRGSVRAYAYFLYAKGKRITGDADLRLKAVYEASELGAGLQIALRDLEIRGAGNLLGAEQHGHVAAVGFTLYCQLLEDAVKQLQGQVKAPPVDVRVDVPLPAFIPTEYVASDDQRLDLYRRMGDAESLDALSEMGRELVDRYGPPPKEVVNLIYLLELRQLARGGGVRSLSVDGASAVLTMGAGEARKRDWATIWGANVVSGDAQIRVALPRTEIAWMAKLHEGLEGMAARRSG